MVDRFAGVEPPTDAQGMEASVFGLVTFRAGAITLLRPEVSLVHDGRREQEDWPALLRNYGIEDSTF